MSDVTQSPQDMGAAAAIEDTASDWLQRRHFWNWSTEDQAGLDAWLEASLAHRLAYWRLEAAWGRTERLQVLRPAEQVTEGKSVRGRGWTFALRAAAVAAVVIACGVGAQALRAPSGTKTYATAPGGHKIITLTDGSQIELNTATVLRVAADNPRNVWLDQGEAYFQIKHDTANPFVVIAAGHRVTDLGTKFLLRTAPGQVNIALIEGRARIDSIGANMQPHSAVLSPGQVAIATPTSLSTSTRAAPELDSELGWRRGVIVFHHTTLEDAVADFNRYGNGKLVIADDGVRRLMLNGTFPTHDTQAFVRIAQQVFRLKVRKDGDQTILSR